MSELNGKSLDLGKTLGRLEGDVAALKDDMGEVKEGMKDIKNLIDNNVIGRPPTLQKIATWITALIAAGLGVDKIL